MGFLYYVTEEKLVLPHAAVLRSPDQVVPIERRKKIYMYKFSNKMVSCYLTRKKQRNMKYKESMIQFQYLL